MISFNQSHNFCCILFSVSSITCFYICISFFIHLFSTLAITIESYLRAPAESAVHLIVLDGTWQQAKGIYIRNTFLHGLPKVTSNFLFFSLLEQSLHTLFELMGYELISWSTLVRILY